LHNLPTTLKRIELYLNSQFENGKYDEDGEEKFFYNIVKPASDVAEKMVDLDTKDIKLTSDSYDGNERVLWMMERDLRYWLKTTKFGSLMNTMSNRYTSRGHFVLKRTKQGKWYNVPLVNLRLLPSASSLLKSPFVYEPISMSRREIASMKEWANYDQEAMDALFARGTKESQFIIYDCYDQNPDPHGKPWLHTVRAAIFQTNRTSGGTIETAESQINQGRNVKYLPSCILFENELDDEQFPYREDKFEDVDGRWLGLGTVEYLFDNQVKMNKTENLEDMAMALNALVIYQTADNQIGRNLVTDARNGDILETNSPITPVSTEVRNLAGFETARNNWNKNTQEKTFTYDVARGKELPSGTTLGTTQIISDAVQSYFDKKRENLGLFLQALIEEDILPAFKEENYAEHTLKFASSDGDIEKIYRAVAGGWLRKKIFTYVRRFGMFPSADDLERAKKDVLNQVRKRKDVLIKAREGIYQDVSAAVTVVITGENSNVSAIVATLQNALNTLSSNPAILQIRPLRTMYFRMLSLAGVSPVDLNLIEDQVEGQIQEMQTDPAQAEIFNQMGQMGGGATPARPNTNQSFSKAPSSVSV
jgi:hypothetical protein